VIFLSFFLNKNLKKEAAISKNSNEKAGKNV
jgi:hypothetical protein